MARRKTVSVQESDIDDHDRLIRIDSEVMHMHECLKNHLKHHWAITLMIATALIVNIGVAVASHFAQGN